jgi:hypothetical protein
MATLARRTLLLGLTALACGARARAATPEEVRAELPGARLRGQGRLTVLAFHVYDARLWVGGDFEAERFAAAPVAIEVEYARALKGRAIAERSLDEVRRQGDVSDTVAARWLDWMEAHFPDVTGGDRLTGIHRPGESLRLFHNGRLRGEIRDAEFARRFIAIWLGPRTSQPQLRQALLGGAS